MAENTIQANTNPKKKATPSKPGAKPREKGTLKPDKLSAEQLAADYGYALQVINAEPEIKAIFDQAVKEQWTPARFTAGLRNTNWYRNNSEYAREAFIKRSMGGADWEETKNNARLAVEQAATASGAQLSPEELQALSLRFINEGWDRPGREMLLQRALSGSITAGATGTLRGMSGNIADDLKQEAFQNGIKYDDKFFLSAARSVNSGLSTLEDWQRDIREQAASLYPVFADKIRAGVSTRQLASPYIQLMSETFEIDANQIELNDPYIRSALGGFDDKGNPVATNLWDFQKKLRNDPRWMNTLQANNEVASMTDRVMQMFGLRG